MAREDFEPGERVMNARTKQRGTVAYDDYGVCAPHEVPVRYDNDLGYVGTDWRELRKIDLVN